MVSITMICISTLLLILPFTGVANSQIPPRPSIPVPSLPPSLPFGVPSLPPSLPSVPSLPPSLPSVPSLPPSPGGGDALCLLQAIERDNGNGLQMCLTLFQFATSRDNPQSICSNSECVQKLIAVHDRCGLSISPRTVCRTNDGGGSTNNPTTDGDINNSGEGGEGDQQCLSDAARADSIVRRCLSVFTDNNGNLNGFDCGNVACVNKLSTIYGRCGFQNKENFLRQSCGNSVVFNGAEATVLTLPLMIVTFALSIALNTIF